MSEYWLLYAHKPGHGLPPSVMLQEWIAPHQVSRTTPKWPVQAQEAAEDTHSGNAVVVYSEMTAMA
jgi:hypothetical protein